MLFFFLSCLESHSFFYHVRILCWDLNCFSYLLFAVIIDIMKSILDLNLCFRIHIYASQVWVSYDNALWNHVMVSHSCLYSVWWLIMLVYNGIHMNQTCMNGIYMNKNTASEIIKVWNSYSSLPDLCMRDMLHAFLESLWTQEWWVCFF